MVHYLRYEWGCLLLYTCFYLNFAENDTFGAPLAENNDDKRR
jgi:hypothetical protein